MEDPKAEVLILGGGGAASVVLARSGGRRRCSPGLDGPWVGGGAVETRLPKATKEVRPLGYHSKPDDLSLLGTLKETRKETEILRAYF